MTVIGSNALAGASGQAAGGGYQIERSLRFNSDDSAYLSRTPSSSGNLTTWTMSVWVKNTLDYGSSGNYPTLFGAANYTGSRTFFRYTASGTWEFFGLNNRHATLEVYRDPSAWYHLVLKWDTTNSTAADRVILYINGARQTWDNTFTANATCGFNANVENYIGKEGEFPRYINAYLADYHFIDGQALDPTDFGEYDANNVWQPIKYAGTYGTNGFHLDFSDTSSNAALGTDSSGNSNTWTVNNLSVTQGALPATSNILTTPEYGWDGSASTYTYNGAATTWTFATPIAVTSGRLDISARAGWTWTANTNLGNVSLTQDAVAWPGGGGYSGWHHYIDAGLTTINSISVSAGANWTLQGVQVAGSPATVGNQFLVFTVSEIDVFRDSPTNGTQSDTGAGGEVVGNYATWNPLYPSDITLSDGNLKITKPSGSDRNTIGTIGVNSGKWYWETTLGLVNYHYPGVAEIGVDPTHYNGQNGSPSCAIEIYGNGYIDKYNGTIATGGTAQGVGTVSGTPVIGMALDLDSNPKTLKYYNNGTLMSGLTKTITSTNTLFPSHSIYSNGSGSAVYNFGQRPFAYTAPSGYKALCTANLSDPTIADGSTAFDAKTFAANNGTQTISGFNFSPDLIWCKSRSNAYNHQIWDTVRGNNEVLRPNTTAAKQTYSGSLVFTSDGFTSNTNNNANYSSGGSIAWAWDAGSSNTTIAAGSISSGVPSIASTVRANPSAGFSIVSYLGNPAGAKVIAHGLSAKPYLIIVKNRTNSAFDWPVYHNSIGVGSSTSLKLNLPDAATHNYFPTEPTSSVFYTTSSSAVGGGASDDMIAYCFAPVEGYSAFGSYEGNGSTDGTFVYTGFKPSFLLIKGIDAAHYWAMHDDARDPTNIGDKYYLWVNDAGGEGNGYDVDFLSNGFKLRNSNGNWNTSGTYIYAAFASQPFKTSRAR